MSFSEELSRAEFERFFAWSRHGNGPSKRPTFRRDASGDYCDEATQRHWWTWQAATVSTRQQARAIAFDMLGCEADKVAEAIADESVCGRWQCELIGAHDE